MDEKSQVSSSSSEASQEEVLDDVAETSKIKFHWWRHVELVFTKPLAWVLLVTLLLCVNQVLRSPVHLAHWMERSKLQLLGFHSVLYDREEYSVHIFERKGERPIIVLPELGGSTSSWVDLLSHLPPERGVVFIELLGHGESILKKDYVMYDDLMDSVRVVLDEVTQPMTIVGHGLGGWLAIRYTMEQENRIERLLLVNSLGLQQPLQTHLYLPVDKKELNEKLDWMFGAHNRWVPTFVLDDMLEFLSDPMHHAILEELTLETKLDVAAQKINTSVDLLWGSPNRVLDEEYAMRWSKWLPEAKVHELEGCGHSPQYFCTEQLHSLLSE